MGMMIYWALCLAFFAEYALCLKSRITWGSKKVRRNKYKDRLLWVGVERLPFTSLLK